MMKCAIGFVVLIACILLSGCGGEPPQKPPAVSRTTGEPMQVAKIDTWNHLRCVDGVVYVRVGTHDFSAKFNKETKQIELCD